MFKSCVRTASALSLLFLVLAPGEFAHAKFARSALKSSRVPVTVDPEPVCVTKAKAELHKGPDEAEPISWTVGKNMPFLKVSESKDKKNRTWFQVKDLEGQKHWLRSSLVSSRVICAVVKAKQAKLKQGPGDEFPPAELATVERYTPFVKVDRDGEWLLVRDDYDAQYWVHEKNLWIPTSRASVSF